MPKAGVKGVLVMTSKVAAIDASLRQIREKKKKNKIMMVNLHQTPS